MEYRNLGNTGLKISEIGLGSWLTFGNSIEKKQAQNCIKTAYDLGINFYDTADAYNKGAAESFLGEALQNYERSKIVLASKCYFPMSSDPNDRGLSRKHIFESVNASLKRLRTDYLDLYQCHRYDHDTPLEETVRAMNDLVQQGKILYWGVSQWTAAQIQDAVGIAKATGCYPPISNQPIYNIINRSLEVEVMRTCKNNGLGIVVFSPLAQGVLTGKYSGGTIPKDSRAANDNINQFMKKRLTPDTLKRVDDLKSLAGDLELTLSQLALAWTLYHAPVTSAIIGASKAEQVEENAKAAGVQLSEVAMQEIDNIMGSAPVDQYTGQPIKVLEIHRD
ncbi:MAG: aldo/keto reductase [Calditrichaeota bacterium]|nr:MAG: aldo/keto reductase [Calditrichota bacterium]